MKYYEELKKKYYETFPEELKIERGSKVDGYMNKFCGHGGYDPLIHTVLSNDVHNRYNEITVSEEITDDRIFFTGSIGGNHLGREEFFIEKNLGIDIDIREVLRMFNNFDKRVVPKIKDIYFVDIFGLITKGGVQPHNVVTEIDLVLPLKEQDEVCKKLLELLK